ncbi:cytochrome c551 [Schinkia sp. CFF1]
MNKKLLALFMGSALVLGACGGGGDTAKEPANNAGNTGTTEQAAPAADDVSAKAEGIFKQSCASCHGQNLEGGVGPDLTKVGTRLDQAGIENILANGRNAMPAGLIQGDDAKAVAEWLAAKK